MAFLVTPAAEEAPAKAPEPKRVPIHETEALEQAVVDATLAFLREQPEKAGAALDRLQAATRRLTRDDDATYTSEIVNYDQAFHMVIEQSRKFAGKRAMEDSMNQFVWVQRTCVSCHDLARKANLFPAKPADGKTSD